MDPRRGMTLMELAVAMGLFAIAAAIFGAGYKTLTRGSAAIGKTADMQGAVKAMGQQIENDVKRAGFGMGGAPAFSTPLKRKEIAIHYKDLLGSTCAAGQVATVRYEVRDNALFREASCDGRILPHKATAAGHDSLAVTFRYLDDEGKPAVAPDKVRTVEYSVELTSGAGDGRKRASQGSVSIVNNG